MPIGVVDIIVLAVLLISAVIAFMRGFVHEVLSIGAWVGAGLATLYGFAHVQPYARELIAIDLLADIGAGVVLFLVVLVLLSIVCRILASRVQQSSLGALDRSLGLAFGLVRGAVIVAAAWLVLTWALPDPAERPAYLQEAKSRRFVEIGADMLASILPASLRQDAPAAIDRAKREADRARKLNEALSQPEIESDAPADESGYNQQQREDMDRQIESLTGGSGSNGG